MLPENVSGSQHRVGRFVFLLGEKGDEMGECSAGECGVKCPGGCSCYDHPDVPGDCYCECSPEVLMSDPETLVSNGSLEWLTLETEVNFVAKDMSLVGLASSVERRIPGRTAIPSASLDSQLTMEVENVRFDELLQECGLIVLEDPQTYAE